MNSIEAKKEEIAKKIGVDPSKMKITKQEDGGPMIVELEDNAKKEFEQKLNSDSLKILNDFVNVSLNNKDKLGNDFITTINNLKKLITEKNAPWFNPLYITLTHFVSIIVFYNTNKILSNEDYSVFMDSIINQFSKVINEGLENNDPKIFDKFPIDYSTKMIIETAEKESGLSNLYESYSKYVAEIKQKELEKQMIPGKIIYLVILLEEGYKKYKNIFNKILIDSDPSKYRLKQPKSLKIEKLFSIGEKLYNKYQNVETVISKFNIPKELTSFTNKSVEEFNKLYEKKIFKKMIGSDHELKAMQDELSKLAGTNIDVRNESEEEILEKIKKNPKFKNLK